jgi:TusE/DsrC/DsvC family sulfur relay protein
MKNLQPREYAGHPVETDDDGFLLDSSQWTPAVGEAIAREIGIWPLTEKHWSVITLCREAAARDGKSPGVEQISRNSRISRKVLCRLFSSEPGRLAARIAGLRKPRDQSETKQGRRRAGDPHPTAAQNEERRPS